MAFQIRRNYCTECDWSANEADLTRFELNVAVVEHFDETHHDIEGEQIVVEEPPADETKNGPLDWTRTSIAWGGQSGRMSAMTNGSRDFVTRD